MATIIITDGDSKVQGVGADNRRMHWIYFLLFGWWIGLFVAGFIIPLFFESGRRFVASCFGYR